RGAKPSTGGAPKHRSRELRQTPSCRCPTQNCKKTLEGDRRPFDPVAVQRIARWREAKQRSQPQEGGPMRRYCLRLAPLSLTALGPVAVYGDDQQIAQQIVEKLQAEKKAGTLKAFSIDLQVDDGTVWLSGRVSSEQQQARALDLARRVSGVKQVVNDLTV